VSGAPDHRELDTLRELVALEDDAGRPVVVDGPLHPASRRLMDFLCVQVRDVTVISAQDLDITQVCVVPGCPAEAEHGHSYCRQHLTSRGEPSMECKIDGCENQAADTRGIYAHLCSTHKAEARARRADSPAPRSSPPGGASLADQARRLVPLATKLDRARARLAELPEQAAAKSAFDEASRRASQSPSGENLARVGECLKQLLTTAPKRTKLENDVSSAERALGLALQTFVQETRAA
jgi:hypothetical protein